jgi:DNA-binding IclR family transcriptional regulator
MLGVLGIEPEVERVYRALLGAPNSSAAVLASDLGMPPSRVSKALAELGTSGLVLRTEGGTFVAAPPAVALGAMITTQRDALRIAEQELPALAEAHRTSAPTKQVTDLIEVVTGVDAVRHRYLQVQLSARAELRHFITAPFVAVPPEENPAEKAATDRGIRVRAIMEQTVLATPGAVEHTADSLRRGVEIRVVDRLPMKLLLADAELALVPLDADADGGPGAVMLQRSGLVTALDALFETTWRLAYPLRLDSLATAATETAGPSALDRQILSLMLGGLTDQAVASQLDISLRTVQRRLRHLQDLAGVRSRMQLGWYAARNDWA